MFLWITGIITKHAFESLHEKTNILVFDLAQHKPGCTATEDGKRLENLDLESRGIVLSMKRYMQNVGFLMTRLI